MLSVRSTVATLALLVVACGDASTISSDHWGGIGTGDSNNGASSDGGSSSGSDGGGHDGGVNLGDGSSQTQSLQVLTDKTSYSIELRSTAVLQVTIAPQNVTGSVTLGVTGLPTDVSAVFSPTSVNVSGTVGATSMLTLTSLSTAVPATAPIQITATAGTTTASASPSLDVLPQITIQIPMNVAAMAGTANNPSTNAFGTYPIVMNAAVNFGTANPIVVKFLNNDSAPHCIHASNAGQGFPHDAVTNGVCNAPMTKGAFDATAHNVNTKGSYQFYLHDQGNLTDGMIKIQ